MMWTELLLLLAGWCMLAARDAQKTSPTAKVFGKFKSVNVELADAKWTRSWPDGIKLMNNLDAPSLPRMSAFENITGYPYTAARRPKITPLRRTYTWRNEDLIISVNMSSLNSPTGTRLVPPITWLSESGSRVRVTQSSGEEEYQNPTPWVPSSAGVFGGFGPRVVSPDDPYMFLEGAPGVSGVSAALAGVGYGLGSRLRPRRVPVTEALEQAVTPTEPTKPSNPVPYVGFKASAGEGATETDVLLLEKYATSEAAEVEPDLASRVIEITVRKSLAQASLTCLRMHGYSRTDIFRMLDKGPWVLAFNVKKVLPRLHADLKEDLCMSTPDIVHILSHCPYLIAQYHRYRGRDAGATARALINAGYDRSSLHQDLMRFPSMLSAPPDRILGWMNLLAAYGVAANEGDFGKYIRRAPYMFNTNAPQIYDTENVVAAVRRRSGRAGPMGRAAVAGVGVGMRAGIGAGIGASGAGMGAVDAESEGYGVSLSVNYRPQPPEGEAKATGGASATASDYVAYDALAILDLLWELGVPDLDKVMRTQPMLLLADVETVVERVEYLCRLLETLSSGHGSDVISGGTAIKASSAETRAKTVPDVPAPTLRPSTGTKSPERVQAEMAVGMEKEVGTKYKSTGMGGGTGAKVGDRYYEAKEEKMAEAAIIDLRRMRGEEGVGVGRLIAGVGPRGAGTAGTAGSVVGRTEQDGWLKTLMQADKVVDNGTTVEVSPQAHKALISLVLTYPGVLSVQTSQMQDVVAALTGEGLSHWEVVRLLRLNPALLSKPPAALRGSIFFFTQYCGLRNAELFPFLQKNSAILGADMATLMPKKDYLYKSLGGTPAMLKRCPAFLSYDLETHIIPRAEFVRALNKDPLSYGLSFLINSKDRDFAYAVGARLDLFHKFKKVFKQKWRERKLALKNITPKGKAENEFLEVPSEILKEAGYDPVK